MGGKTLMNRMWQTYFFILMYIIIGVLQEMGYVAPLKRFFFGINNVYFGIFLFIFILIISYFYPPKDKKESNKYNKKWHVCSFVSFMGFIGIILTTTEVLQLSNLMNLIIGIISVVSILLCLKPTLIND